MQVRITIPLYKCAPDGHTVLSYPEGFIVTGRAAQMALADQAGEALGEAHETKITPPPETKAKRARK